MKHGSAHTREAGERPASDPAADVELLARVAAGDRVAQRVTLTRLMRRVQRLARALVVDREDASDASQLSLLQILRSAKSYRGESSLECWSDRIVVRTTLRYARTRRRLVASTLDAQALPNVDARADPLVAVSEYLNLLGEDQRIALVLRCGFEYSVEEIAALTQTSPNTIKDRLKRARQCVRRAMRRDEFNCARRASGM